MRINSYCGICRNKTSYLIQRRHIACSLASVRVISSVCQPGQGSQLDFIVWWHSHGDISSITTYRVAATLGMFVRVVCDDTDVFVLLVHCYNSRCSKTGKRGASSVKLYSIPPTTESFTENVHRCHLQVTILKSALLESPPEMDSTKYGCELDHLGNLVPRTVHSGTLSAPPDIQYYRSFSLLQLQDLWVSHCGIQVHDNWVHDLLSMWGAEACKNLWHVASRKMNPKRLLRTQIMMICDETIIKLMLTHHKHAKLHSCLNKLNLTLNVYVFSCSCKRRHRYSRSPST